MKIRTQIVLAFLLLSVLPLTGLVLYSYLSSQRAVRQVMESEAAELAQEMNGRMSAVRAELGRGVERVGEIPIASMLKRKSGEGRVPVALIEAMGETAPLLDSIEYTPAAPSTEPAEAPEDLPSVPAPPLPPAPVSGDPTTAQAPAAPAPPAPHAPMVIDVQQILRQVEEVGGPLSPQEAADIDKAIREATEIADQVITDLGPGSAGSADPEREPGEREVAARLREIQARAAEMERQHAARQARLADAERRRREARLLLGTELQAPVKENGKVVGWVSAQVGPEHLLRRVLGRSRRDLGEIPFAVDAEGKVHAANQEDLSKVRGLPLNLRQADMGDESQHILEGWVVATSRDRESGLTFGVARPIRQSLAEVKRTAARNFGYGLALIGVALVGILPLSNRMTRDIGLLRHGAERIASGDLGTRVSVRSRNEIGALASAFNHMAGDLRDNQERLVEQETEQRLLRSEYERKTRDLEEARTFQLSLLPKTLPAHPAYDIAVSMQTATEVGGDYYDFHHSETGVLTVAVGDATGHGARAGTMVTVVKSLFSADSGWSGPKEFLTGAATAVKRMELGRMAMGLILARLEEKAVTLATAGMPPALLFRAVSRKVEEIVLEGMPLGGLASDYKEVRLGVEPGDTLLLMSDGLPELQDGSGEPFGYVRVRSLFERLGGGAPDEMVAGLIDAAREWTGGKPPSDDMTFVVVRVR